MAHPTLLLLLLQVASNSLLYAPGEHPDHVVVIKYVPYVSSALRSCNGSLVCWCGALTEHQ